jgi:O-antigen ligase
MLFRIEEKMIESSQRNNLVNILKIFIYILLLLPFFKVPYLTYLYPSLTIIYNIFLFLSAITLVILTILKKRISKIIVLISLFMILVLFSTIINNGSYYSAIINVITVLTLSLLVDFGINYDLKPFLNAFEFFLFFLVLVNFLTIVIYPNGLYPSISDGFRTMSNWFLGYKNNHILFIMPSILISLINSYLKSNHMRLKDYLLIIISILTLVLNKSSTGIVGIALIIFMIAITSLVKDGKLLNIVSYFIAYIISFFSIVIFRIQNVFYYLIVEVLHKDITFTGRTYIWDYVMEFIKEKPLFGYGIEDSIYRLNKTAYWRSYHAHDQILEVIYKTGFIGLFFYFEIIINSIIELFKYRSNRISQIISIVLFSYFIMMITEAYSFDNIIYLFVIGYNVKVFINNKEELQA